MFVIIKYANFTILCLCTNYLWLLWHVSGFINFPLMIDLYINGYSCCLGICKKFGLILIIFKKLMRFASRLLLGYT